MSTNTGRHLRHLTLSAILCALVFAATTYTRIPIWFSNSGYIHLGDAFIYLAAALLPTPYACAVGAVGAGLSDLIGYPLYAPGTVLIKVLMTLFFTAKRDKLLCKQNMLATIPAGFICVAGYYVYEAILTNSFAAPLASVPFNIAQAIGGAVAFFVFGLMFDKLSLKGKLLK